MNVIHRSSKGWSKKLLCITFILKFNPFSSHIEIHFYIPINVKNTNERFALSGNGQTCVDVLDNPFEKHRVYMLS